MSKKIAWKCPACGEVVKYDEKWPPSDGDTYCHQTGGDVQMERVEEKK